MARAVAKCKCKVCGAEFTKSAIKRNRAEAHSWEAWAESTFDLCPSCWGKEQRELEQSKPLTLVIDADPYNLDFVLHFEGGTKARKDEIKALGYQWQELPATGTLGLLSVKRPPLAWVKRLRLSEIDAAIAAAGAALACEVANRVSGLDLATWSFVDQKMEDEKRRAAELQAALAQIAKPEEYPAGRWNGKIYGSEKYGYRVYVDGEEAAVTAQQIEAWRAYEAKIKAVKDGYRG